MKCETCSKEHDGSYGSGRFCCQSCARSFSTKKNRKEISKKVSETYKNKKLVNCKFCGKPFQFLGLYSHEKFCKLNPNRNINIAKNNKHSKVIEKHLNRKVVLRDGTELNCTYKQLDDYKDDHLVCEICGKTVEESVKYTGKFKAKNLCIDHDHSTNEFRGLLCQVCNRQLGWYENNKEKVNEYLQKQKPFGPMV